MLFSSKILRAAGEGVCVAYVVAAGAVATGAASFFTSSTGAASALAPPAGAAAAVSIRQTTCPTATASPSSAFRVITPLASAGSSNVALSESTSAIA